MSTEPTTTTTTTTTPSARSKRVVVPKVWKRPHSTIYGKNVEYGSSLYSDKIGEINGRKFNSDLPWTMRNSGTPSSAGSSSYSQGYLSKLMNDSCDYSLGRLVDKFSGASNTGHAGDSSTIMYDFTGKPTSEEANSYVCLLDITNPNRYSQRFNRAAAARGSSSSSKSSRPNSRIDFYEQFGHLDEEISRCQANSLLATDPLVRRRMFDDNLDFDYTIGIFVPKLEPESASSGRDPRSGRRPKPIVPTNYLSTTPTTISKQTSTTATNSDDINQSLQTTNPYQSNYMLRLKPTHLHKPTPIQLELHEPYGQFGLNSSPYGVSADGRKLSLGSINPHSYRPSLPSKTTTAHSTDGEEFEFHDRSSPFYTDRWAGKTIRHFDSDLYSNANLFKSMIFQPELVVLTSPSIGSTRQQLRC